MISGDTAPSPSLIKQARGADVLVHETLQKEFIERFENAARKQGRDAVAKIMFDVRDYHTSPEEAADMVAEAVIKKPKRIATPMGIYLQVMTAVAPRFTEVVMNIMFRMFHDSAAARGEQHTEKVEVSKEQVAIAALMKGVHF